MTASPRTLVGLYSSLLTRHRTGVSLHGRGTRLRNGTTFCSLFVSLGRDAGLEAATGRLSIPRHQFIQFLVRQQFICHATSNGILPCTGIGGTKLFYIGSCYGRNRAKSCALIAPRNGLCFTRLQRVVLLISWRRGKDKFCTKERGGQSTSKKGTPRDQNTRLPQP